MKILEIPFETIYKCDLCGCKFEIEPDDLSVERVIAQTIDGQHKDTIISLYVNCPYCRNEITIQRKMNPNGEQSK